MKRTTTFFKLFSVILFSVFTTSCNLFKSRKERVKEKVFEAIKCFENNDKEGTKKQFAKTKVKDVENFDDSVDKLLEYYDGTFVSIKYNTYGEFGDKNYEFVKIWYLLSIDVKTTVDEYRMGLYYCSEYTTDKDCIGIWSLSIILKSKDPNPAYSYGGDGKWEPGIHIGKVFEKENDNSNSNMCPISSDS